MKKVYSLLIVCAIALIGCSSSKTDSTPKLKPLTFHFKPPTSATESNEITFGLLSPSFVESFQESSQEPYITYAKNMENDFLEMLTARGYKYKGPFANTEQMVYSDKKDIDLLIVPVIDLQFTGNPFKQETSHDYITGTDNIYYSLDGDVTVTATMNLSFTEPFTNTKVWVKSLKTNPSTFKVKSYHRYTGPEVPNTDPLVWNTLATELNKIYDNTLQTVWNHLEPAELMQKKNESVEIKKNSGFIKN